MSTTLDDTEFDRALVASAFALAADRGWLGVTLGEAARAAGLSLSRTRERFPNRLALLHRFGDLLDISALAEVPADGPIRDGLFDVLMRRFDGLQAHRAGVLSLMKALPFDPAAAGLLACGTQRSMRWMLDAVGVDTRGIRGELRTQALVGVWLWGVRAWQRDESLDLSGTMAAIDTALDRADGLAGWTGRTNEASSDTSQMSGESDSAVGTTDVPPPPPPDSPLA